MLAPILWTKMHSKTSATKKGEQMIQAQKEKTKKLLITQMPVSVTDQNFAIITVSWSSLAEGDEG